MRKLTYWKADNLQDGNSLAIRERTREACQELVDANPMGLFGKPRKVVLEYEDAFDLVRQLTSDPDVLRNS